MIWCFRATFGWGGVVGCFVLMTVVGSVVCGVSLLGGFCGCYWCWFGFGDCNLWYYGFIRTLFCGCFGGFVELRLLVVLDVW